MESLEGEILERFEIERLAGKGGMGRVYRARDKKRGELVALKLLPAEGGDRLRFAREIEVLAALDHPAIVRYLDGGFTRRATPYLVMEWLEGETLAERLGRGRLDVASAIAMMMRVADGLAAAHRRGVVHRDLKPANVLLVGGAADQAKLIDFGVARPKNSETLTVSGTIVGTPAYMAPEQISGERADERSDVYGLGALLFSCLSGQAPFHGPHDIAVLAKVVLEPPPSLRALRPDVPDAVAKLVQRLLAKSPVDRPHDAAGVYEELSRVSVAAPSSSAELEAVAAIERRVTSFVLMSSKARRDADTVVTRAPEGVNDVATNVVADFGGTMHPLLHGAMIITLRGAASPTEQAARAARCALALSAEHPASPVVVATGRVVVSGDLQVGEAIDRAAERVLSTVARGVEVDEATAHLLGARFEIQGTDRWRSLVAERPGIATRNMLLGRPSPCVGRAREIAQLESALAACVEESRADLALITAPPGLGKSRLMRELLDDAARDRSIDVLSAAGDAARAGSTFGLASQLIASKAGILETDDRAARRVKLDELLMRDFSGPETTRLAEVFGEIAFAHAPSRRASDDAPSTDAEARTSAPAELKAARADATTMLDAIEDAWVTWLRARSRSAPVVIALEDLHWADLPSLRLVDAALAALADRPLFVVATSRPEGQSRLAQVFAKRSFQEIRLGPLSAKASEEVARATLGEGAGEETLRKVALRAAGNPFFLEEILRAVAAGQSPDALPDSVLGMVQARFDELDAGARQALRVASVFGESFWGGAVSALVSEDPRAIAGKLRALVDQEVLVRRPTSRFAGEIELGFRHAILRDAAYETLTDEARVVAHKLAGAWLEKVGESDPAVLAEHFDRGGARDLAGPYFLQASRRALDASDLERAERYAERAATCSPDDWMQGGIAALLADVAYWRGEIDRAVAKADEATRALEPASAEWFAAASSAISALGQRGSNDAVAAWMARVAAAAPKKDARGAHAVALCRAMAQLLWAHHRGDLAAVKGRFDELAREAGALEPFAAGWVHRVEAERAWLHDGDVDTCLASFAKSRAAFEAAGAVRMHALATANESCMAAWSGDTARALDLAAQAAAEGKRVGARFLVAYSGAVSGLAKCFGEERDGEAAMRASLVELAGATRLAFICRFYAGFCALERGDVEAAEVDARAAAEAEVAADLRSAGIALVAMVELARGDLDRAVDTATRAVAMRRACADYELTDGIAELALAEALEKKGDRAGALAAIEPACARIVAVASTIADANRRARFLSRRVANDRIAALRSRLD